MGATMASTIGGAVGGAGGSAIGAAGTGQPVKALPTVLSGVGGGLYGAGAAPGIAASKAAGGGMVGQIFSGAQSALGFQSGAQKAVTQKAGELVTAGYGAGAPIGITNTGTFSQFPTTGLRGALTVEDVLGKAAPMFATTPSAAQGLGFQPPLAQPAGGGAGTQGITATPKIGAEAALPTAGVGTTGVTGGMGGGAGEVIKQVSTKTPMLEKLLGANWRQTVLGAGIAGAPLLFGGGQQSMLGTGTEPFTPEQSALFKETTDMVRQGAQVQLTPAQQQSITANYDTALEQARQNIMDRYKMLRPGSDIENDSNFREALVELESDFAEKKANALASAQLGLSQTQTQMMAELANMEVGNLAQRAGISYAESRDFKQLLSNLWYMVATAGQPIYTIR